MGFGESTSGVNYLFRGMQLKYPSHANAITVGRAEEMLQNHCYYVSNYSEELEKWRKGDFYSKNVIKLQLPFVQPVKAPPVDPEVLK